MNCAYCGAPATGVRTCDTCGNSFPHCPDHPLDTCATCTPPSQSASATSGGGTAGGQTIPGNRIAILSWNLQNFTGDRRCGRSNGAIASERNRVRAAFVAAVMRATQAAALLVMETGSDVSDAMESIRREANGNFDPFVSERTHATPAIRNRHSIRCGRDRLQAAAPYVRTRDVWMLRNLYGTFDFSPGPWSGWSPDILREAAIHVLCELRGVPAGTLSGSPITAFERVARGGNGPPFDARALWRWGQVSSLDELVDLVEFLRYLRLKARDAGNVTVLHATECLEVLRLIDFFMARTPPGERDIARLMECGPQTARFRYEKVLPTCLFLLLAYQHLDLTLEEGQVVDELDDARMIYDALQHFGCLEFHYETYGILLNRDVVRMDGFLNDDCFAIIRFNDDGTLLGTQTVGSTYNWRSALRMILPLAGGRWLETLLFHTRFTPSAEALADDSDDTQREKTYRMRAAGIEEIARLIAGRATGIPIAFFGDFNLPMSEVSNELARFSANMDALGFVRHPAANTATTLRAIPTLTQEPADVYSQAYDALYAHGISPGQISCRVLPLDELVRVADAPLRVWLEEEVKRHYVNEAGTLHRNIANHFGQLERIRMGPDPAWGAIAARSQLLQAPDQRLAELDILAASFGAASFLATLHDEMALVCSSCIDARLSERLVHLLDRIREELRDGAQVLGALENEELVRFAVAYESIVSDHLPLLAVIDLDAPVPPDPVFGK